MTVAPDVPDNATRASIRRQMRRRRRALTPGERHRAAARLARRLRRHEWAGRAHRIGIYLAGNGELDPLPAFQQSPLRHKQLYLPVLDPLRAGMLRFVPWTRDTRLIPNRFGIPEPSLRQHTGVATWTLDLILMPLVAFDDHGNRLGMGGGFYDRTLEALWRHPVRPRLVGVAHRFQRVEHLPTASWDVPLDTVITD